MDININCPSPLRSLRSRTANPSIKSVAITCLHFGLAWTLYFNAFTRHCIVRYSEVGETYFPMSTLVTTYRRSYDVICCRRSVIGVIAHDISDISHSTRRRNGHSGLNTLLPYPKLHRVLQQRDRSMITLSYYAFVAQLPICYFPVISVRRRL